MSIRFSIILSDRIFFIENILHTSRTPQRSKGKGTGRQKPGSGNGKDPCNDEVPRDPPADGGEALGRAYAEDARP